MCQSLTQCECENEKHFDGSGHDDAHSYSVSSGLLLGIYTPYGLYHVCGQCADTCLKDYR